MTSPQLARGPNGSHSDGSHLTVTSISLRVFDLLRAPGLLALVDSAFAEACNLVTNDGRRFSLVSDRVGDGPLNAVVNQQNALALLDKDDLVSGDGRWLTVRPGWRIDLSRAVVWSPYPNYEQLAKWPGVVRRNLTWMRSHLPLEAPPASLAAMPSAPTQGAFGSRPSVALVQSRAGELTGGLLKAYGAADLYGIKFYARRLAGLGPGLTPAGDDWLAGWLVGLRARNVLADEDEVRLPAEAVGRAVLQGAHSQTHAFSLAFLQAAAEGAVARPWHDLLDALTRADPVPTKYMAEEIMRIGATSGSDMLAGFLAALDGV